MSGKNKFSVSAARSPSQSTCAANNLYALSSIPRVDRRCPGHDASALQLLWPRSSLELVARCSREDYCTHPMKYNRDGPISERESR